MSLTTYRGMAGHLTLKRKFYLGNQSIAEVSVYSFNLGSFVMIRSICDVGATILY